MAAKPSATGRWATSGAVVTEPPSGVMDVGHEFATAPNPHFENWLKNLEYQWQEYLKDLQIQGPWGLATQVTKTLSGSGSFELTEATAPGVDTANVVKVVAAAGGSLQLTGLSGGFAGRLVLLLFTTPNSGQILSADHEAGASAAADRFAFPYTSGGRNQSLYDGHSLWLFYDGDSSRWRLASNSSHLAP